MKIHLRLLLFFSACCLPTGLFAQAEPTTSVAGIRVIRETIGEDQAALVPFNTFNKGTTVALILRSAQPIIRLDINGSKIDAFTDDKGTNLLVKNEGSFQEPGYGSFPEVSADGKAAMLEISGGGVPAEGAAGIEAKGTLILWSASKKESVRSEPFELVKGAKITVGEIELKVSEAGKPRFGDDALEIEFESGNKLITMLAGVRFLDESGKELESESGGSSSMGFGNKYTYGRSFSLKQEVKGKVVVQFDMWTDLAETKVPFAVSTGIGGR